MSPQALQHQRVRFGRGDIVDLDALPSAQTAAARDRGTQHLPRIPPQRRGRRRVLRWLGAALGLAAALALLFALAVYFISASGIGKEKLRAAAERALEKAAGRDMTTAIGGTHIALDGSRLVGLEVSNVGLQAVGQPRPFAQVASLRFGIELLPLLSGRVVLNSATLSDIALDAGSFGSSDGGDWLSAMRREDGLIDPDKLPAVIFSALQHTFVLLERDFSGQIELSDVVIDLPTGKSRHRLEITAAEAVSSEPDALSLSAEGFLDGRPWGLSGVSERDRASGRISRLDLDLVVPKGEGELSLAGGSSATRLGTLKATLEGAQGTADAPSHLLLHARSDGSAFDLKNNRGVLVGDTELSMSLKQGDGAARIDRLQIGDGRSSYDLTGMIRPRAAVPGFDPAYGIELAGSNLVVAAADSTEPPFRFAAKVSGSFEPSSRKIRAETVNLTGGGGSVSGSLGMQPVEGKSSGIDVALAVSRMPIANAKQLWPWFAGRGVRNWTLAHVSGGVVEEGRIDYHMAPGRIGSGVPAAPEELSGRITVTGTQFDTTGKLPPIGQADGLVSFEGTEVAVAMSQGRTTLPSGRTLAFANGAFTLHAVNKPPLIGKLEVDVEGEAAAAAELAAAEPINALNRVPFTADDLSGTAKAHVSADIPLQRDTPRESLGFAVSLDFAKLSIAKPMEGQTLRDAQGTLKVDPQKAVIQAAGKLNGAPAKLDFTEPLKPDAPARSRRIQLTLDDKARNAIAPGLSTLISGPAILEIDASTPKREVSADLSDAKLSAPWVSWSKGAGIPAAATFTMTQSEGGTALSDLEVSGGTFRLAGSVALDKNGLVSAQFPSVKLNRGDDLAVTVRRKGRDFNVTVSGKSYDARALVKAATAQTEGAAAPSGSGSQASAGVGVSLTADVQSVSGFGNEALKGVSVTYRDGGKSRALTIKALTDAGGAAAIDDATKDGRRRLALQTTDAGSMLRFLNIYGNMRGGQIDVALAGPSGGTLNGKLDARSFSLVNEPRLGSLVSSRGGNAGSRSLQEAVKANIDTSQVRFDRASADIEKGPRSLAISGGVLRGSAIGSTFQGVLYDEKGRMDMTGTFMPAYGLNRLFGALPLVGLILGNGNDRGLIGVTFKLQGSAKSPIVTVNPLSVIAPGIFRQIFEFD